MILNQLVHLRRQLGVDILKLELQELEVEALDTSCAGGVQLSYQ